MSVWVYRDQSLSLARRIALIAGCVLPGCGAKTALLEDYPPNDAAHFDGNRNNLPPDPSRCGPAVLCERANDNDPCSLNGEIVCARTCGRRPCSLICQRAPDDCARWESNNTGPLPPPELMQ